ncbi:hypothetical protein [Salinarimonas soli]|uniref:Uncharacterized protein n=1 Tax=Salinarimonas soli TaxID=1638099 RepID=A0A5B2VCH1_9HYPH|nr:hypothetical protein [Salinarimonas soli]KAA2236426.1 hypothetical protein F0L46_14890 [Salinarimonas soli]
MRVQIAAIVTLCSIGAAEAKEIIRCTSKNAPEVVMSLDAQKMLKRTVSCISGSFVSDMTPCATNGGYGLSYPTGSAALREIVTRWQDYNDHHGGVVSHGVNPQTIVFSGSWMSDNGNKELWTFIANRLTGTAKLKIPKGEDGAGEYDYTCLRASQKF